MGSGTHLKSIFSQCNSPLTRAKFPGLKLIQDELRQSGKLSSGLIRIWNSFQISWMPPELKNDCLRAITALSSKARICFIGEVHLTACHTISKEAHCLDYLGRGLNMMYFHLRGLHRFQDCSSHVHSVQCQKMCRKNMQGEYIKDRQVLTMNCLKHEQTVRATLLTLACWVTHSLV